MKAPVLSHPFDENRELRQSREISLTFWDGCTTIIKISARRQEPGGRSARPPPYAVFRPGTQNKYIQKA